MLMQTPAELLENLLRANLRANSQPWRSFDWHARHGIAPAPKRGYVWQMIGEEKLIHVVQGRPKLVVSPVMTLVERQGRKYTSEKIRALDAERGCGNSRKVRRDGME